MNISEVEANREALLRIMNQKNELDHKIEELGHVLHANRIGMTEPLVDREGFPRNDIDVVAVRHARHDIICLQNERRALMVLIERGLNDYYQRVGNNRTHSLDNRNLHQHQHQPMDVDDTSTPMTRLPAFATVEAVTPGLAAERAGLESGDQILQLGTLSARNFKSLNQIHTIMVCSIGQNVRLLVRKHGSGNEITINLTPPNLGIKFQLPSMNGH